MVKKQHIHFGDLLLPPTSLKILSVAMAKPAFLFLQEKKTDAQKYDSSFLYHSL